MYLWQRLKLINWYQKASKKKGGDDSSVFADKKSFFLDL